jgi:protein-disulfide isomerase
VPTQRILAVIAAAATPFLLGAACTKESKESKSKVDTGAIDASDRAGSGSASATAVDTTPLPGISVEKLDKKKQDIFYRLLGTLTSPCGKGESLRKSFTSDTSCKRAPFAVRLVAAALEDEATEVEIKELYKDKYQTQGEKPRSFMLDDTPHVGVTDAPVVLVEFYDYACPACAAFKPELDKAIAEHGSDMVIYFKQYPLVSKHPDSHSAAQAALAAYRQDKFAEMHDLLFKRSPAHKRGDVIGYAKQLGLDMPTFEADYDAMSPKVDQDLAQGDAVGVDHTPTLYLNGIEYKGPHLAKYLGMWIDEEVAVNR